MASITSSLKKALVPAKPPAPKPLPAQAPALKAAVSKATAPKAAAPKPAASVAQRVSNSGSTFQPSRLAGPVELNPKAAVIPSKALSLPLSASTVIRQQATAFTSQLPEAAAARIALGQKSSSKALDAITRAGQDITGSLPASATDAALGLKLQSALNPSLKFDKAALKAAQALKGTGGLLDIHTLGPDGTQASNATSATPAEQGAQAVQDAYEAGGADAAAAELDRQTEVLGNDQAAVDALIAASQDTIDQIAEDTVNDHGSGADERTEATLTSLSHVADRASDTGVENLTGSLAEALPADWPSNNPYAGYPPNAENVRTALETLSANGEGARLSLSLGHELEVAGKLTANDVSAAGIHALDVVQQRYTDARTEREKADAELQQQLADLGDTLTPQEQQEYINAYKARYAGIYQAETDAAQALDAAVSPNVALIDQAVIDNPSHAEKVVDVMSALASSPLPATAVEWGVHAFQDGSKTAEAYADVASDIRTEVVEKGLPGTAVQYQAEAGGDPNAALDQLNTLYSGFKNARKLFDSARQYEQAIDQGQQFLSAARAVLSGDYQALERLTTQSALKGLTPTGTAFAGAAIAFGIANAQGEENLAKLATNLGNAGRAGLELYSTAIGTLNKFGQLSTSESYLARASVGAAEFISTRLIPGVSFGVNAITAVEAAKEAFKDPSFSSITNAIGSAISFLGSAIQLFPPTAIFGKAVEAVGALVSTIGLIAGEVAQQETRNNDEQAILEQLWRDDPYFQAHPEQLGKVAGRIADGNNYDVGDIADSTGLDREEVFDLIYRAGPDPDHVLPQLIEIATSVGLEGDALVREVLAAIERDGGLKEISEDIYKTLTEDIGVPADPTGVATDQYLASIFGIEGPDSP